MKRSFLATSILLAAAGCSANQDSLVAANSDLTQAQQTAGLAGDTFLSNEVYAFKNERGETVQAKVQMKFIPAADYSLDGTENVGLEYEVTIDTLNVATGKTEAVDSTFFARRSAKPGAYELFDCDSTHKCRTDYHTSFTVAGDQATLKNDNLAYISGGIDAATISFTQVK